MRSTGIWRILYSLNIIGSDRLGLIATSVRVYKLDHSYLQTFANLCESDCSRIATIVGDRLLATM